MTQKFHRSMPVLPVADVQASIEFYHKKLGFSKHEFGDPAAFVIFQRGSVTLAIQDEHADQIEPTGIWAAYIYVENIDMLVEELAIHDVHPLEPAEDQDYGCRDITLRDPDGHHIAFGQDLHMDKHGAGLGLDTSRDSA